MGQVTNGIAKVEFAPLGVDGTVGTVFAAVGLTNLDSASLAEEDGTTTDFNVEETDLPIFSRTAKGKTTLAFQVADPDLAAFAKLFGGTVTGTGATAVWDAPRTTFALEQSVKITPEVGFIITIPRGKVMAKMNSGLGKNSLLMIDITVDILLPTDEDTAPLIIGGVA